MRVLIIPGNGGCGDNILACNWYRWLRDELRKRKIPCVAQNYPDSYTGRQSVWLPHIREKLKLTEDTVLVGSCVFCVSSKSSSSLKKISLILFVSMLPYPRTLNWGSCRNASGRARIAQGYHLSKRSSH